MIQNKKALQITIVIWFFVAFAYLNHTPLIFRSHDWDAHLQYTDFIVNYHHLPSPYEGLHTYHPPLYYLINSILIPPSIRTDPDKIHSFARALSVVYGAATLVIIAWFLSQITQNQIVLLLVLSFIATTPKFVMVFSTFNNDSLATLLCIAAVVLSYKLYHTWTEKSAITLLIVATAANYTKYTSLFCIAVIAIICLKNIIYKKPLASNEKGILLILALSMLLLSSWLLFHNKHYTGKLFPTSFEEKIYEKITFENAKTTLSTVLKFPPIIQPEIWKEPWPILSKEVDYFSFSLVTSVIGEWIFHNPSVSWVWNMLLIHFLVGLFSIREALKTNIGKLAISFILITYLVHIANISRVIPPVFGCFMDYRYISWSWIAWAVLYTNALSNNSRLSKLLIFAFSIGIFIHVYFLLTCTSIR